MRVLLTKDSPDLADLVRILLGRGGHVVELARSGEDGLWLASEFSFDVVLLDWVLPGISSPEVCRRLRGDGNWVPILMFTATALSPIASLGFGAAPMTTSSSPSPPRS